MRVRSSRRVWERERQVTTILEGIARLLSVGAAAAGIDCATLPDRTRRRVPPAAPKPATPRAVRKAVPPEAA